MLLLDGVHTSPLSLFSSSSTDPFALFTVCSECDLLPEDAGIVLLHDDSNQISQVVQANEQFNLRYDGSKVRGATAAYLDEQVAHIQSPNIRSTFIHCPPIKNSNGIQDTLGIKLSNIHFHLCPLGYSRPFCIEVGVQDRKGVKAKIRCSTFQSKAKVYGARRKSKDDDKDDDDDDQSPLLHLPIVLPPKDNNLVTEWMTLSLPLASLMSQFNNSSLLLDQPLFDSKKTSTRSKQIPRLSQFDQVDYVRVHANCRLRKIWFTIQPQIEESRTFTLHALRTKNQTTLI